MKTHRIFFDDAGNPVAESVAAQIQELTINDDGRVVSDAWFKVVTPVAAAGLSQSELPLTPQPS